MESNTTIELLLASHVRELAIALAKKEMKSIPQEEWEGFLTEQRVLSHVPEALRRLEDVAKTMALQVKS